MECRGVEVEGTLICSHLSPQVPNQPEEMQEESLHLSP